MTEIPIKNISGNTYTLSVRIKPQAKKNEITQERSGAITISTTKPPVNGKANKALLKYIKKKLHANSVEIIKGHTNSDKIFQFSSDFKSIDMILSQLLK